MVLANGRLWRTHPAVSNNRPMPERRLRLAGNRMLPMQDAGELATGCDPSLAGHAHMEARSISQMPLMPERPLRATGAHDQVDGDAHDHTLQVGAPG